jgi:hypothetical protein
MLEIKLNDYGVENTLTEIRDYLELAIESNSKKQKNEMIYKALGAVRTLYYVIDVTEVNNDTESVSDT